MSEIGLICQGAASTNFFAMDKTKAVKGTTLLSPVIFFIWQLKKNLILFLSIERTCLGVGGEGSPFLQNQGNFAKNFIITSLIVIHLKVIDRDTGEKLGPNQVGEICVKSPFMLTEYLNRPEVFFLEKCCFLKYDILLSLLLIGDCRLPTRWMGPYGR